MVEPAVKAPARLGLLDPLRGLLAVCVAVYHLGVWFAISRSGSGANIAMARLGNYSVSAFFVLSGFLLFRTAPWARIRREGLGRFWLRRFLRLAPLFYLACTLNLVFRLGMGPSPTWGRVLENATFTFALIQPNLALVTGGWYVGLVALMYFAYPALAWLREKGGIPFLAALATGLWLWSLPATLHGVMAQVPLGNRFNAYVMAPNQVFLLAWGGLLGALHARSERRLEVRWALLLALLLVWVLVKPEPRFYDHLAVLTGWLRYRYVLIVTGLVALAAFTRNLEAVPDMNEGGPPARLRFAMSPLVLPHEVSGRSPATSSASGLLAGMTAGLSKLGDWSFGLYLLHPFMQHLVAPHLPGLAGFALALLLAFVAAALAHRWIEEPMGKLGRA